MYLDSKGLCTVNSLLLLYTKSDSVLMLLLVSFHGWISYLLAGAV